MRMRIFIFSVLLPFSAAAGFGADPYQDFPVYVTADSLKPFAKDLGGLLGSALYTTARSIGFSGFDLGFRGAVQFEPSPDNEILKKSKVKAFWFPWVQAEIGMPFRLDGFIRGFNYQGLTVSGGGLRWGITKVNDMPYKVQVMLVGAGHAAVHRSFSITHFNGSVVCSYRFPKIVSYAGMGFDRTNLVVKEAPAGSGLAGGTVSVLEPRFTLGVNIKPAQFVYLALAGNLVHGQPAFESSIGIRF